MTQKLHLSSLAKGLTGEIDLNCALVILVYCSNGNIMIKLKIDQYSIEI